MEMMRLHREQLQMLAASRSGLPKEVEEVKSGTGRRSIRRRRIASCRFWGPTWRTWKAPRIYQGGCRGNTNY